MRWIKPVGLPLAYLIGVVWAMQPPPPTYTLPDKTVIDVTDLNGNRVLSPDKTDKPIGPPGTVIQPPAAR